MAYQSSGWSLGRFVEITNTANITDISTPSDANKYQYVDAAGTTHTYYNNLGRAAASGDMIVLLDSQAAYLMAAITFDQTYPDVRTSASDITALTDNSGGTATSTIAAITVTTPADLAAVATQLSIIRNAIASLSAKVNAIIAS